MRQKGFALIIIVIILAVVGIVGTYYLGTKTFTPTNTLTPENTVLPSTTPTVGWKTFQVPKTEYSKEFTLYYPSTWEFESRQVPLRLSKGSIFFEFRQGAGSVGSCLFNDDKNNQDAPEFASIFPSYYKEIKKSEQMTWRLAIVENPNSWDDTFILCQKLAGESFYTQYTNIGYVPFRVPQSDTQSLNEIVEILTKIEITE